MNTNLPFGFTPGENPEGFDSNALGQMFSQLGAMLQSGGAAGDGPVNWTLAKDTARQMVAQAGDPSVLASQASAVADAVALAQTWLDPVTVFPVSDSSAAAWSRSEWIEATMPAWQRLVEPIAVHMQGMVDAQMPTNGELQIPEELKAMFGGEIPPEMSAMLAPMMGMMKQLGAMTFAMQLGQGLAMLSGEVLGAADIGIPLTSNGRPALLPANVQTFGEGLELPAGEVLLYLAMREAAHQRLFAHVPWLRARLEGAIEEYARGIKVDPDRLSEAMREIDVQNPQSLQDALASGVFQPQDTPEQLAALARLETMLALIEGWVDNVVSMAVVDRLPSAESLREAMRRRRGAGGPAEKTFANLVGLELRPRKLREAATLWGMLVSDGGIDARDALWAHPDLLPTSDDLDDPVSFIERSKPLDLGELDQ